MIGDGNGACESAAGYVITGVLGHGSQGTVYEAQDPDGLRDVAIKVLEPRLAQDPTRVERFFDEARAAASIRHGGVVEVYEHGTDDAGRHYIVMERLRGETLFARLRRASGGVTVGEAVGVLRQLASALIAMHGAPSPIVHRDLKPENVFLVGDGDSARVVIMDLGIAKLAVDARSAGTWSGGGALGTPPYMSPEQCRGDDRVDLRSDIYALGCLLHEMIAGTPPFGFGPPDELLRAHRDDAPPPLRDAGIDVPDGLDALARAMLAKDPALRPASCLDVIEALDALDVDAHVPAPVTTSAMPAGSAGAATSTTASTRVATRATGRPGSATTRARAWRRRAWERWLEMPPWIAGGAACMTGSVLLGMSVVLGVGESYLAQPNWSFTYVVLVPLIIMLAARGAQQVDAAVHALAARGIIRGDPGVDVARAVDEATSRMGGGVVAFAAVLTPISVGISVAEWHARPPVAGEWWSESAITGCACAVAQGLFTVFMHAFALHAVAWAQLLLSWTSSRSRLHLRAGPDAQRAFDVLEEPLALMLAAGALVQVVLYLSTAQAIAVGRGAPFWETALPFREGAQHHAVVDAAIGHYSSGVTVIASAMIFAFLALAMWCVRRALVNAGAPGWPLRALGFGASIGLVAALFGVTVYVRLGPALLVVAAVLVAIAAWRRARDARAKT